jgi:hypothetical protein
MTKRVVIDRSETLRRLSEIARSAKSYPRDKVQALSVLAEMQGFRSPPPPTQDPCPADELGALRWRLEGIRRRMAVAGDSAFSLLNREERYMLEQIRAEEERLRSIREPTPEELLALVLEDLPRWSDAELLAVHAEGLRRGIPGFGPR